MTGALPSLGALLLFASLAGGAELPVSPTGRVSDLAGVLSPQVRDQLGARIAAWEEAGAKEGAPQIAVVTLPALGDEPIEDVTMRLAERWRIGSKADDGVLIALAPTERKVRIEVGYGLEGKIPDAVASRIIREIMAPKLRGGDFGAGLTAGAVAVHQAMVGQPITGNDGTQPAATRRRLPRPSGALAGGGGLVLLLVLLSIFGRRGGGGLLSGLFLGSLFGRRGGGGGGGGDTFGGGGGSFGGGGASGDY